MCGDTLESYPKLKEHLMEHAGYNPCECQICGKILSTSAQRAKHEITHTKTKTPRPDKSLLVSFNFIGGLCDLLIKVLASSMEG